MGWVDILASFVRAEKAILKTLESPGRLSFVRQDERSLSENRREYFLVVVELQNAVFPVEQVFICADEFVPGLSRSNTLDSFADQKEVCPGDRLVIPLGLAVKGSEAPDAFGDPGQSLDRRVALKVEPAQPDVISMMKALRRQGTALESDYEFFVVG